MKHKIMKDKYYNYDLLYFDNIDEVYNFCNTAPRLYDNTWRVQNRGYSTDDTDEDYIEWAGGYTFEESMNILKNGSKELADKIEDVDLGDNVAAERIVQHYINDIVGVIPHVPNAVLGLPQSMINIVSNRVKTNNKIINLILDADVPCYIEPKDYLKISKLFLNIVDKIETMGYRCNIYYALNSEHNDKLIANVMIKLKSSNEPFNKYKCAFVLGSLSMFRQIGFRITECTKGADISTYGDVVSTDRAIQTDKMTLKECMNIEERFIKSFNIYEHINSDEETIIKTITRDISSDITR